MIKTRKDFCSKRVAPELLRAWLRHIDDRPQGLADAAKHGDTVTEDQRLGAEFLAQHVTSIRRDNQYQIVQMADGREVTATSRDRGMVFQDSALLPWRTVRSNIELALQLRGEPRAGRRQRAEHWIDEVGLTGFADYLPKSLSGGMRQRVQLARGLAGAPRAVMMDEPFAGLDTQTRAAMQRLLIDTWRDHPTTIVFVTHDVDEALILGNRVAVLGPVGQPLRAVIDVPEPRTEQLGRHALRAEILAGLDHT